MPDTFRVYCQKAYHDSVPVSMDAYCIEESLHGYDVLSIEKLVDGEWVDVKEIEKEKE